MIIAEKSNKAFLIVLSKIAPIDPGFGRLVDVAYINAKDVGILYVSPILHLGSRIALH